ncbi:hypothetical protein PSM7751_03688 [Pseudooceanicola marinus]|uniref:DUF3576 domain-containing protein n=1 Tax=Pseudooceanicola marinus TaxID=396013 RepID=A0A1X7A5T5_9RHOB|nr:DUF3576 domain-containing protein [Pseudooceanicola marinus]PJE31136.1 DUF3576 domain-containing protein [Pseudooceanicola marinus]SLN69423.1 hypothetical protein PSM7751_03688 [Pseudooceanicola marinus]
MISSRAIRTVARAAAVTGLLAVAACGNNPDPGPTPQQQLEQRETIWDLFNQRDDGTKVAVNRYLWNASLEVLNFLPVEQIDPFTGVITFGYGTPPGGGRAYRATVYISDPALEARSLNVSIQTRGGSPVAEGTQRAVEDAILTRARQLRVSDRRF